MCRISLRRGIRQIESRSDVRLAHLILDLVDSHVAREHRIRFATKDSEIVAMQMDRVGHGVKTIGSDLTVLHTHTVKRGRKRVSCSIFVPLLECLTKRLTCITTSMTSCSVSLTENTPGSGRGSNNNGRTWLLLSWKGTLCSTHTVDSVWLTSSHNCLVACGRS